MSNRYGNADEPRLAQGPVARKRVLAAAIAGALALPAVRAQDVIDGGETRTVGSGESVGYGDLIVGDTGEGTLVIEGGGTVDGEWTWLGKEEGGVGTVVVSGEGSAWQLTGGLQVARWGTATIDISDGGTVSAFQIDIGAGRPPDGGAGTVTVSGAGSVFSATDLLLGEAGTVTISDGGAVAVEPDGEISDTLQVESSGTLNIGAGAGSAAAAPGLLLTPVLELQADTGTLVFNHTASDYVFDTPLWSEDPGEGRLRHLAGTTILTSDDSDFSGATSVEGGTLIVNSALGNTAVSVLADGALGGSGTIGGPVHIGGGTLLGVSGETLTLGSLELDVASIVDVRLGAPSDAALFDVTGDLTLDGTLNVTDAGGFGEGVYRLIDYGGTLTDETLEVGSLPAAVDPAIVSVQTAVANQVNLLVGTGGLAELKFWDGGAADSANNGAVDGGDGTWTAAGTTWTDADGAENGAMSPSPGFAIFQAEPGTVTVDGDDGPVAVTGMQFAADGYVVEGDPVSLAGTDPVLRVGDGTAAGADFIATIDADLQGTRSVRKTDLGTLVLNGTNTWDTTTVEDGTLVIGGTLTGALVLEAGGWIGGSGTLGDVDNAGTVAPGDSIGTLTVAGDYIHRADATLRAEIEPGGTSDRLDVGGTATLEGGTVEVVKLPGQYSGGTRYTLVDAAGGVGGTFDELVEDAPMPFLELALAYDENHVYLDVMRNTAEFSLVCDDGTVNQCEVAGALDAISAGGAVTPDLETAMTEVTALDLQGVQAAFDRLSGEVHASFAGLLLEGHALQGDSVTRRLSERRVADRNGGAGLSAWIRGYGRNGDVGGDGTAHGADIEVRGAAIGVDGWLTDSWLLGLSVNTMQLEADARPGDRGKADTRNVSLYTSIEGNRAYVDGVLSYGWWDNEVARAVEVGGLERRAQAEYDGDRRAAYLEAGYEFDIGSGHRLTPLFSVLYDEVDQQAFRERGAGDLGLIGRGHDTDRVTTGLGLRWSTRLGGERWTVEPSVEGRWLRMSRDRYAELEAAWVGAPRAVFQVRGVELPRDRGVLVIGIAADNGEHLQLFADFNYQDGDDGYDARGAAAGFRWRW